MALLCPVISFLSPLWSPPNYNVVAQVAIPRTLHFACRAAADHWSSKQDHLPVSNIPPAPLKLCLQTNDNDFKVAYFEKMEDIRRMIKAVEDDPVQSLVLVDAVQRLGIDHHFSDEIDCVLRRQYEKTSPRNHKHRTNLHETSLRFRLLRQEGHYIPSEIFCNFLDVNGKFNETLTQDIRGLMELYEAAQLNMDGEEILDEAATFSRKNLHQYLGYLDDHHLARIVRTTLQHPYHKSIPKFMAKNFIKDLKCTFFWVEPLREFARLEFVVEQRVHREEFARISSWWEGLNLCKELKLARNQPLKWYTWSMAILPDLRLSEQRIALTKCISFVYIIDDIFDVYGILHHLTLFTQAVNRWKLTDLNDAVLPDHMKICLKALNDLTNEISYDFFRNYGHNPVDHLRKTWAILCDAFLVEAKWFATRAQVRADEYLENGRVSVGVHVPIVHLFFLLGHFGSANNGISLDDINDITSSVATILRLLDDLESSEDENEEGHDGSYVDIYVKEHKGRISHEHAKEHVMDLICKEWKHLNKESLRLTQLSPSFTRASLNIAKMVPSMNTYDDNTRLPLLQNHMKSILFDDMVNMV